MATYDVTGTTSSTSVPSRKNPGVRTPYLVENTIDISKVNSSAGTTNGDVLQVIDIPAETLVLHAGIEVLTALSSSATMDFGTLVETLTYLLMEMLTQQDTLY